MIVVGHRGGFGPGNTLLAFKKAKTNGLKAVELDVSVSRKLTLHQVWITSDGQLAVIHGGFNGEMPSVQGTQTHYIYELTLEEAR